MFNEDIINLTQQTQKGIHVLCRRTRQFFLIVIVNNVFHEILYFLSFFFFCILLVFRVSYTLYVV